MMTIHRKSANAVGGRTARACDACVRRCARWYCTADDAFLCQVCDISVHSANQLASRHERVRLESSGIRKSNSVITEPSWLHGFTKKARSRRHAHINNKAISKQEGDKADFSLNPLPLVPDIGSEETSIFDENDERILYQVPVFNPFACEEPTFEDYESKVNYEHGGINDLDGFNHLPSENELAEFTAHMESLLGEEGSCDEKCGRVKVEDHVEGEETIEAALELKFDQMDDAMREISDWKFEYESTMIEQEVIDEEKVTTSLVEPTIKNNKMALKLNYDDVITSWANQGSPWQTGIRPEFNLDDCWPDFNVTCPTILNHRNRDIGGNMGYGDGEREARVTRYKEKRRTRLFSKKIRYEVRKLNAEKRPRMRGRFVKRTSFPVPIFPTK